MRGAGLCVFLGLLLVGRGLCELQGLPEGGKEGDLLSINILNRHGTLGSHQPIARNSRSRRPPPPAPKRNPQGSRYALSLDVPTNILNVLIDLAKNHELRTKAAANAELMARIGRRK